MWSSFVTTAPMPSRLNVLMACIRSMRLAIIRVLGTIHCRRARVWATFEWPSVCERAEGKNRTPLSKRSMKARCFTLLKLSIPIKQQPAFSSSYRSFSSRFVRMITAMNSNLSTLMSTYTSKGHKSHFFAGHEHQ